MRCIAIDDEPLALELIKSYVEQTGWLEISETFTDALKAKEYLASNEPDLLFLDIQMPDINGMQLFSSLEKKPPVIFTTAYSHYAVEGFNLDAVDYLLKPFEYERFLKAATKAKELVEYRQDKEINEGYLFVKYNYQWNKIFFKEIEFIEALDDYIKIYTTGKPYLIHMSMKTVSDKLPSQKFIRVHRSYIVPVEKINSWNKNSLRLGNKIIPVSYTYQKQVHDLLQKKLD
ncbi:MAG: LytR/AlgR family response regulator transcription factor [Ilyomonas sp.]